MQEYHFLMTEMTSRGFGGAVDQCAYKLLSRLLALVFESKSAKEVNKTIHTIVKESKCAIADSFKEELDFTCLLLQFVDQIAAGQCTFQDLQRLIRAKHSHGKVFHGISEIIKSPTLREKFEDHCKAIENDTSCGETYKATVTGLFSWISASPIHRLQTVMYLKMDLITDIFDRGRGPTFLDLAEEICFKTSNTTPESYGKEKKMVCDFVLELRKLRNDLVHNCRDRMNYNSAEAISNRKKLCDRYKEMIQNLDYELLYATTTIREKMVSMLIQPVQ